MAQDGNPTAAARPVTWRGLWAGTLLSGALLLSLSLPLMAASSPTTLYVATTGSNTTGTGTSASPYATIQKAVAVATAGDVIIVEPGTYTGSVTITTQVTLEADPATGTAANTILNAAGQTNGILLVGNGASGTEIKGLTIENAQQAGLLAKGPISRLQIRDNILTQNDQEKPPAGVDYETLHLMSSTDSVVEGNQVINNKDGGIYLTDEFGPSSGNKIIGNTVEGNAVDCGITLASHVAHSGVYNNLVADNLSKGNGAAGIMLATPVPGGRMSGNVVTGNTVEDNGLGGIDIHTHAPGSLVYGNVITYNTVSGNAPDFGVTTKPTGIDVGAAGSPIIGTIISYNTISSEYYGINETALAQHTTLADNTNTATVPVNVPSAPPPAPKSAPTGGPSVAFALTHHPFGFYGASLVALQQAADAALHGAAVPSLFNLTHHVVGFYGASAVSWQQAADVAWSMGIRSWTGSGAAL